MTKNMNRFNSEDYFIHLRPQLSKRTRKWTGQVAIQIIVAHDNSMDIKDKEEMWHLCKMLCSLIPMMEDDPDLMEDVDDFARNYMFNYQEDKKGLTITGKKGNVIQIDFKTKTEGSA
tara:strand:- start:944 stop:1294 length:351 start_codon:yes stop_codon:yes gene_type:complete